MKIFLAGNDASDYGKALDCLHYPHRLLSYYYAFLKSNSHAHMMPICRKPGVDWIMDSGLYTFMFGSEKGKLKTFEDYRGYAQKYVETMHAQEWNHGVVECDVQRVLGVEECFRLREELFDKSGLDVIYVWHIPEGIDGLRKLAKERARIAISVPELRAVFGVGVSGGVKVTAALIQLLRICRASGPARVHLLGATEPRMMRLSADSCDSTTWQSGRWGFGKTYAGLQQENPLPDASMYSPKWARWVAWCEKAYPETYRQLHEQWNDSRSYSYFSASVSTAVSFWLFMEALNGRQRQSP